MRAQDIQSALNNAFAQRQVSTLYTQRNQYRVILEIDPQYQRDPIDLARIYVPGANGAQVPLTAVTTSSADCSRWSSTTRANSRR